MNKIFSKVFGLAILSVSLIFSGCGSTAADNSAQVSAAASLKEIPTFTTDRLDGEQVSSEIFARKKITVLNVWGTFCPPCIAEMPELGEWAKNMPADAQLVGLVCDVSGPGDEKTIAAAKNILDKADAKFMNFIPNKEILPFLQSVDAVPTTFFVDAQGKIIGEPIIGAQVDEYKKRLAELLK